MALALMHRGSPLAWDRAPWVRKVRLERLW